MSYPFTDAGHAERFVAYNTVDGVPEVMYVPGKGWHVWNEDRWLPDPDSAVLTRLVVRMLRSIPRETKDDERRLDAAESSGRIKAVIELAAAQPGISVPAVALDADPYVIGTPEGSVDLRTGFESSPTPTRYITQSVGVHYDRAASKTPALWTRFLNEILPDAETVKFLQRALGYSLTGSVSEEVIFLLVGKGANGKSTLVNTVRRILGDYAAPVSTSLLTSTYQGSHDTDKLALQGIRFGAANETGFGDKIAEAKVKSLVSTEAITARGAYQKTAATFNPTHKLWLSTNYLPNIDGSDEGLARRLIVIDFPNTFKKEDRDPRLQESLLQEGAAILNWMIEGARLYLQHGLNPPQTILDNVEEYRDGMDTFARFLEEHIEFGDGYSSTNPEVWDAFTAFQQSEPAHLRLGRRQFGQAMKRRFRQTNNGSGRRWPGIRIRREDHTTDLATLIDRAGL
jgi:putative DNA primase/helicase